MGAENAEVLTLVCPHCGKAFLSVMQMDPHAFAAIQLETMREHCPTCGRASWFTKSDYKLPLRRGSVLG
jgi:endogenous inhibitor of DNA gyrase (YacG/DUF329 family)